MNATLSEINTNRSSWQPWLSKTLNSIQEKVATRRDVPSFQSYIPSQEGGGSIASGTTQQVNEIVFPLNLIYNIIYEFYYTLTTSYSK